MPQIVLHVKAGQMSTRRLAYWWFWFVASGRFVATFLYVQPVKRS